MNNDTRQSDSICTTCCRTFKNEAVYHLGTLRLCQKCYDRLKKSVFEIEAKKNKTAKKVAA